MKDDGLDSTAIQNWVFQILSTWHSGQSEIYFEIHCENYYRKNSTLRLMEPLHWMAIIKNFKSA